MRYSIFIFILLPALSLNSFADTTYVRGSVSGVWNLGGSPYITQGDIFVPSGLNLTIEPGVEVILNWDFVIYGGLTAEGAENDSIYFIRDCEYVRVQSSQETPVVFRYCHFPGASVFAGIWFQSGDITFDRCSIHLQGNGSGCYCIYCICDGATISNNYLSNLVIDGNPGAYGIAGLAEEVLVINNKINNSTNVNNVGAYAHSVGIQGISGYIIGNIINSYCSGINAVEYLFSGSSLYRVGNTG